MTTVPTPQIGLESEQRTRVSAILQASLSDLIALALQLKQAHWNLTGPQFRAVHEQLDEIELAVRGHADDVAERMVTLGVPADGLPETVARDHRLEPMAAGRFDALQCVETLSGALAKTVRCARETLGDLADMDPVSEDLVIGMLGDLEKHEWMLRAQIGR